MKIKVKERDISDVLNIPKEAHIKPKRQSFLMRYLLKLLSEKELKEVNFKCEKENMDSISADEPVLFLMNHSSFIDLKIASKIIYPRQFHIVCTLDGFVGKRALMQKIGCIPARKFINDISLVKDLKYAVNELKSSILMFPEASYSFDGTETALPESLGKLICMLRIPVVMIKTEGAFIRDPLYNALQIRKTDVSAKMSLIFSKKDIDALDADSINDRLRERFDFDYFREQQESDTSICETFRADYLERVIYKCPHCLKEGAMEGRGIKLYCKECGCEYILDEKGFLKGTNVDTVFTHIPDWYRWQRTEVKKEIERGEYELNIEVEIKILADTKALYSVGDGVLKHDLDGFTLADKSGILKYQQHSKASYSLYADYFWYEIGDVISIGDARRQYYCFPKDRSVNVCKARLATEEIFKLKKNC